MVYSRHTAKYTGRHRHMPHESLSDEADRMLDEALRSAGFSRKPNVPLENFKKYWNSMNRKFKQDADGNPNTLF